MQMLRLLSIACTRWALANCHNAKESIHSPPSQGTCQTSQMSRQRIWQVATQRVPGLPRIRFSRWALTPCHDAKESMHSPPSRGTCQTSQMSVDYLSRQHAWLPSSHGPVTPTHTQSLTSVRMIDCTTRAPNTATMLLPLAPVCLAT